MNPLLVAVLIAWSLIGAAWAVYGIVRLVIRIPVWIAHARARLAWLRRARQMRAAGYSQAEIDFEQQYIDVLVEARMLLEPNPTRKVTP
jgi:hypothetical protein